MKKNYFLIVALLLCFGFGSFSQENTRKRTVGLERYQNLDIKKLDIQEMNGRAPVPSGLNLIYSENFDQGVPAGWTFFGSSASCKWAVDATANPPGYFSAPYSLNYNNGVDYDCGRNYGFATSPFITAWPSMIQVKFQYIRGAEDFGYYDVLFVSILDEFNNTLNYYPLPISNNWLSYTMDYEIPDGINKIKLEFYFDTGDELFNNYKGAFIDNIEVYMGPMIPLSNWAVVIGIFLVAATIFIRFRRFGS